MVGIYKIVNIKTGKTYVGQSNDIKRRFKEHQTAGKRSRIPVDVAIQKYGKENFSYEVIEECALNELNERETYWITQLKSNIYGYNCNSGGNQASIGAQNGRAKLTEEDVKKIRAAYAAHLKQKEVYEAFKNKVTFAYFQNVWAGKAWSHIMPEVFTEENKQYYIYNNSNGDSGAAALLTNQEVIELRKKYVNHSAKELYTSYQNRISFQAFQQILWGRTYTTLPIYKKKEKKWINI